MREVETNLEAIPMKVQPPTARRTATKYNKEPGLVGEARREDFPEEIVFV